MSSEARVIAPGAVKGLGTALRDAGFSEGERISPERRSWLTLPKELLRSAMLPMAPRVALGSVRARAELQRLQSARPEAATLFRLLTIGETVENTAMERNVPASLREMLEGAGIAGRAGNAWRANFRVVPAGGAYVLTDFVRDRARLGSDFVQFGLDSALLAQMIASEAKGGSRALDLCTGSGIQAMILAPRYDHVDATDLNVRALALARANAALNGVNGRVTYTAGNLYEGTRSDYDLIVANPPFMFLPDELRESQLTGYGGQLGIEVTLQILEGLDSHLAPAGEAFVHTQGPRIGGACQLVEATRRRLAGTALRIEFEEILRGYWGLFRDFYKRERVEWLTCYRVRVRRSDRLEIVERNLSGWRRAVAAAGVVAEKWM